MRRQLRKLWKNVKALKQDNPWHTTIDMTNTSISCDVNAQGWFESNWGTRAQWEYRMDRTPILKSEGATKTTMGTASNYTITGVDLLYPDATSNQDFALENNTFVCISEIKQEIRNNEQYPMYLWVYRYITKDSHKAWGVANPFLGHLDSSLSVLEAHNTDTETQNKENPAFRLGLLTNHGRGETGLEQFFKIQNTNYLKLNPGQTVTVIQKNKMLLPMAQYKEWRTHGTTTSFLSGRLHGIVLCLRGCVGVEDDDGVGTSTKAGLMKGSLQIWQTRTWKTKYLRKPATAVPTYHWADAPTVTASNFVKAAFPGDSILNDQQTNS